MSPKGQAFRCDVCMQEKPYETPKIWRRKGDFNRHLKIHSNDKPYKCDECGKAFVQHSALKTHRNTHTGARPFKCGIKRCLKRFGDPSSCSRHRREAHSELIGYRCPVTDCPTKIKRRSCFVNHLKRVHNMDQPSPARLEKMAIRRHDEGPDCESSSEEDSPVISDSQSMYATSSSSSSSSSSRTTSLSPSPSPEINLPEVYVPQHNSNMPYQCNDGGAYEYHDASMSMTAYHGSYILPMPQPSMTGIFTEEYTYDPSYDALYLNDASSSVPVIWNATGDLASYSPEREYTSMTAMYERLDSA